MESYVLIARSITYGQRMQCVLQRGGVRCRLYRAPRELSHAGCGYGVEVASLGLALSLLQQAGLHPLKLYRKHQEQYQEVAYDLP